MPANRTDTGKFIKGVSGNPNGRPKTPDEVREAFKAATLQAAQKLISLMDCGNVKVEFMAAQEILNRTLGKPETSGKLEISGVNNEAIIFRWINEQPNTNTQTAQPVVTTE